MKLAIAVAGLFATASCAGSPSSSSPAAAVPEVDYAVGYRMTQGGFPDIAQVCVQGLGFAVTDYGSHNNSAAATRVPEWDTFCAAHRKALP